MAYCTGIVFDKAMPHGHISLDARGKVALTHEAYMTLQNKRVHGPRRGVHHGAGAGDLPEPDEPDAPRCDAEDLIRSLDIIDPEPSPTCTYPPCLQPTVTVRDGFPLCSEHHVLLQGWDELVEAI